MATIRRSRSARGLPRGLPCGLPISLKRKQKQSPMAKYGERAHAKVEAALHEEKAGTLKSGSTGKTVTSRKKAIAIGLSEARRAGGKVPTSPKKAAAARKSA